MNTRPTWAIGFDPHRASPWTIERWLGDKVDSASRCFADGITGTALRLADSTKLRGSGQWRGLLLVTGHLEMRGGVACFS